MIPVSASGMFKGRSGRGTPWCGPAAHPRVWR